MPQESTQEPTRRVSLVVRVWGPEWDDVSFASIELSRPRIARLMEYMALSAKLEETHPELIQMSFMDYTPRYHRWPSRLEEEAGRGQRKLWEVLEPILDSGSDVVAPGIAFPDDEDGEEIRTEGDNLEVTSAGIEWEAYIKHTDDRHRTDMVGRASLLYALCHIVPAPEFPEVFRQLIAEDAGQALRILEKGSLNLVGYGEVQERPLPALDRSLLQPLISHTSEEVRRRTVLLLDNVSLAEPERPGTRKR